MSLLLNKIVYLYGQIRRKSNEQDKGMDEKGISQTELANMLGKSFNMVNLYATNKVQPPVPVLYQIAELLNIDVRTLLIPNKTK